MSTGTYATGEVRGGGAQPEPGGAQQQATQAAEAAQRKAQEAAGEAKSRIREQLEQRSSQAAEQVGQQASDLRAVGDSLRQQGKDGPAQAAERLAEYAERVAGYLGEKDSDALLHDAEDLARRQPWAIGAGALALGFAASRFLKASSHQRYTNRGFGRPEPSPSQASGEHRRPADSEMPQAGPPLPGA